MIFKILSIPMALSLAFIAHSADAKKAKSNRSMDSQHQPVVSYVRYDFDVRIDNGSSVSAYERERLAGWLSSIEIGYGDHVSANIATGYSPALADGVGSVLAGFGLLLEKDSAATLTPAPAGVIRVSVRRATAKVPGCPDWGSKKEVISGLSSNFGCAINSNMAAMIANPEDLLRGKVTDSDLRVATSTRAIQSYQTQPLTGGGALKNLSAGGQ
jgi:pilus assembly protein CpaD